MLCASDSNDVHKLLCARARARAQETTVSFPLSSLFLSLSLSLCSLDHTLLQLHSIVYLVELTRHVVAWQGYPPLLVPNGEDAEGIEASQWNKCHYYNRG